MNKEPGYVYILTNDVRSKELDNTAVPLPFEIFATMKTTKYNEVEKLVSSSLCILLLNNV